MEKVSRISLSFCAKAALKFVNSGVGTQKRELESERSGKWRHLYEKVGCTDDRSFLNLALLFFQKRACVSISKMQIVKLKFC